jgi:hypothetical protein
VIAGSISFARTGGIGLPGRRRSAVMEQQLVGLDVSQVETVVCVDAAGVAV